MLSLNTILNHVRVMKCLSVTVTTDCDNWYWSVLRKSDKSVLRVIFLIRQWMAFISSSEMRHEYFFMCVWIVIWKLTMSYDFHNNYPRNRNYVLNSPWIWVYHYFVKIIIRLSSYRDWTFLASKHSFLLVTRFCRRFYHRTLIVFVISRTEETHSRFFGCSTR